jgi:hypothetical protein
MSSLSDDAVPADIEIFFCTEVAHVQETLEARILHLVMTSCQKDRTDQGNSNYCSAGKGEGRTKTKVINQITHYRRKHSASFHIAEEVYTQHRGAVAL